MGWHPDDKKAELFHDDSRFIRVLDSSQGTHLIAYTMFRFDTEEDLDEHVLPVLYWSVMMLHRELEYHRLK